MTRIRKDTEAPEWVTDSEPKPERPIYREFPARVRPARSSRTDRCTEPGCDKTIGEHIEEFRAYGRTLEQRIVHL